jgi:hypothetical protein
MPNMAAFRFLLSSSLLGSPEVDFLLFFIDLSMISSQKTPGGIGRHWDPMFARLSASSLLV